MTVAQLAQALSLTPFSLPAPQRQVRTGYAGDLLSWVMSRATPESAWLTIMSNQNVAAVALMSDVSCVILTENIHPDEALLSRAKEQGVNLLGTKKSTYEMAVALQGQLGGAAGSAP